VSPRLARLAAHLMECAEDDLEFEGGKFTVKGTDKSTAIQEVAFAAFMAHNLPDGIEPFDRLGRDLRTRRTSRSARYAPLRHRGSTTRPAG